MSLRRDIHSAFDGIAPSPAGLSERVVQTVLAEGAFRDRRQRFMFRMRAPLSLVAVLLVIAVVAAVLVGGRLISDWNALHRGTPAGQSGGPTLAQLEARPLTLLMVTPSENCTTGPFDANNNYGTGPFHGYEGQGVYDASGTYFYWFLSASVDQGAQGLMLIRIEEVRTGKRAVFVDSYATGSVVGSDTLRGRTVQQRAEMVFDMSHPPARPVLGQTYWSFTVGAAKGFACFGWQIDGTFKGQPFTEKFYS